MISMLGASSSTPDLYYCLAYLHNIAVLLIMSFIFSFNIKKTALIWLLSTEMLCRRQERGGKSRDLGNKKKKKKNKKPPPIIPPHPLRWSVVFCRCMG